MEDNRKLVGGIWMPATETHMIEVMTGKGRFEVEGKLTYQYRKLRAALDRLPLDRRRRAIDIGGHVGLWSMWLVRHFKRLEAFEPIPLHADLFEQNVNMDLHGVRCTLNRMAVGATSGIVRMQVPDETTGNSHVAINGQHPGTRLVEHPDRMHEYGEIEMRSLDSFEFTEVDFIKIDVEGFEKAVVLGAEQTIRACRPLMVVEQKGNDSVYGDKPEAAVKLLQKWGMKPLQVMSGDWILDWA